MIVGKLTGISKWLFRLRNSLRRDTVKVQCTKRKQVEKRYIIKENIYITKKKRKGKELRILVKLKSRLRDFYANERRTQGSTGKLAITKKNSLTSHDNSSLKLLRYVKKSFEKRVHFILSKKKSTNKLTLQP